MKVRARETSRKHNLSQCHNKDKTTVSEHPLHLYPFLWFLSFISVFFWKSKIIKQQQKTRSVFDVSRLNYVDNENQETPVRVVLRIKMSVFLER